MSGLGNHFFHTGAFHRLAQNLCVFPVSRVYLLSLNAESSCNSVPLARTRTGTVTSVTFEHYYLQAVSKCMFSGTPADVAYCHQLANLCVLQLYDRNSQACMDHLTIVQARSTVLVNSLTNWVTGNPWLFFGGSDANALCTTHSYLKRMTLSGTVVQYVLAGYYMNGTFAGGSLLAELSDGAD